MDAFRWGRYREEWVVSYQHGVRGDGQVAQDRAGYHELAVSARRPLARICIS